MLGLDAFVTPKKEQNNSIKLQPVQDFPFHSNQCGCQMCKDYESKVVGGMLQEKSKMLYDKIRKRVGEQKANSMPFQYVLKRLITPHHKVITQHLSLLIPQICFYKDGEALSLYMNVDQIDKSPQKQQKIESNHQKQQMIVRIKKQKLTNTQIQKIFNEKRRKYKQRIGGNNIKRKLSKKRPQIGKKQIMPETKQSVLIVSYLDGYEQLLTENQFISLTLKRKQDPIFRRINFIKNFIGTEGEAHNIIFVRYDEKDIKYESLMSRSQVLMKVFATNIIAGEDKFISAESESKFSEELTNESKDALAHYTVYKIVSFIETFYDEKITFLTARLLINEQAQPYLIHIYSLRKQELVKYTWTQDAYMKKVQQQQHKLLARINNIHPSQKNHHRSRLIQAQMTTHYENIKTAMGLGQVQKNDSQQIANNNFFALLHPNLERPISQILKNKNMTIQKFKEECLGYTNKKRPVAQAFNSNLVKTLHKMTPQLHIASGHELEDAIFPKRGCSMSQQSAKRSFSLGNTMSSVNKTMTIYL